ncbi:unnamed protein product [Lota lota]
MENKRTPEYRGQGSSFENQSRQACNTNKEQWFHWGEHKQEQIIAHRGRSGFVALLNLPLSSPAPGPLIMRGGWGGQAGMGRVWAEPGGPFHGGGP